MGVGQSLVLPLRIYDLNGLRDDTLGGDVTFDWSISDPAGGTFAEANPDADANDVPDESSVLFTAGMRGNYTITAALDATECVDGCSASLIIRVP